MSSFGVGRLGAGFGQMGAIGSAPGMPPAGSATFSLITAAASSFSSASTDGKTWSAPQAFSSGSLLCNAWSPTLGLFAALGSSTDAFYGPDGVNWTQGATVSPIAHFSAMIWVPSKAWFASVPSQASNDAALSSDGNNWTVTASLPSSSLWFGLGYSPSLGSGNGRIVTVGTNVSAWSDDGGQTWTAGTISAGNWKAVKWLSWLNVWIATANGTTTFATSSDGKTFTNSGTALPANPGAAAAVAVSASLRIVMIVSTAGTSAMTSGNLTSWTNTTTPAAYNVAGRSEALGLFVGVSAVGATGYSANGTSWTAGTTLASDTWGSLAVTG